MIKLSPKVLSNLGKVPKTKSKAKALGEAAVNATRRQRTKLKGKSAQLQRLKVDTVEIKSTPHANQSNPVEKKDNKNRIWNFFERDRRKIATQYTNDLESVAQEIPEASFSKEANTSSVKGLESTLDKLLKNEDLFAQGGLSAAVRDGVRGTLFIPHPEQNYMKIVKAMEKRGYKIADTFLEKDGKVVLDSNGFPKMGKDIDVRFGDNAVPSGYEDVQMRFSKGKNVYELLILPGPNYLNFKNKEHELVYEQFRKYKSLGFRDDRGAKEIINAMKEEFNVVTRQLYADAKYRDTNGASSVKEAITFSPKGIQKVKEYLKSLKTLFAGKHAMLPPSKQTKPFKQTQKYQQLDEIEQKLDQVLDIYKPIEK